MPKKPKAYFRPDDLDEALAMLAKPGYVALGGGAHLLATEAGLDAEAVVDLQGCGLGDITYDVLGQYLEVGAMTRLVDLSDFLDDDELGNGLFDLLQEAIHRAGPNTYRNAATLGGVIASRLPDSELLAALLAAEATISLRLPQAETVSLAAYLDADGRPAGLITTVRISVVRGNWASERLARTPADYPIVSVVGWRPLGKSIRLAATGTGERPLRLSAAETAVATTLNETTIAAAAAAAQAGADHPGDFRGDAAYRAEMAAVLTRRVLRDMII